MRTSGIRARRAPKIQVSRPKYRTSPAICQDLINRDFRASGLGQIWLIDITRIRLTNAECFLCAIMDLYSRRIVASSVCDQLSIRLPIESLRNAIEKSSIDDGLIVHSDRGPFFASNLYRQTLNSVGAQQSMGQTGCYDNAPMESFFRTLKAECCAWSSGCSIDQFKRAINGYINGFYNLRRRHSSLGFVSPSEFERRRTIPKASSP